MFKRILLLSLIGLQACNGMQSPLSYLNPLANPNLKEACADFGINAAKNLDTTIKTLTMGLQEGLSDTTASLTQTINGSTANLAQTLTATGKTVTQSATEVCRTVNFATERITASANKLIDAGVPALNQNINALVNNGVQARLSIDPATIKTLCFATYWRSTCNGRNWTYFIRIILCRRLFNRTSKTDYVDCHL